MSADAPLQGSKSRFRPLWKLRPHFRMPSTEAPFVAGGSGGRDELLEFLSAFHYIYPNLNDTFAYACADSEKISLDVDEPFGPEEDGYLANGEMLVKAWRAHGHAGIRAFVAKMRGQDPIKPLLTEDYYAAKAMLEGWSYDPD